MIYQQNPILAGSIARQMEEKHQLRDQAERELLGFDHAEVGALLIEAWGLSAELAELTRCHHQYQLAQDSKPGALILAFANLLADADTTLTGASDIRLEAMMGDLGIDQDGLAEIIESGEQQCQEVKTIILG